MFTSFCSGLRERGALGPGPPPEGDAPWLYRETDDQGGGGDGGRSEVGHTALGWGGVGPGGEKWEVTGDSQVAFIPDQGWGPACGAGGEETGKEGGLGHGLSGLWTPHFTIRPWSQQGGRPPPSVPRPCFPVPTTPLAGPGPQGNAFQQLPSWAPRRGGQEGGPPGTGFSLLCFVQCQFGATLSSKPWSGERGIPLCSAGREMLAGPGAAPRCLACCPRQSRRTAWLGSLRGRGRALAVLPLRIAGSDREMGKQLMRRGFALNVL